MTVKELIELLKQLPQDLPIRHHDYEFGSYPVTGAFVAIVETNDSKADSSYYQKVDGTEWRDADEQYIDCVIVR